jgi:NAD(P)-dependent dehydrogenase (short-subunit alcohol dehydrogenase family)
MDKPVPLIGTGTLKAGALSGQVAIVTGGGQGIGYEATRALLWLGAQVVVAEIDRRSGRKAARQLQAEFEPGRALFIQTDVGSEPSVRSLARRALKAFGRVDVVLNNAAVALLGAVKEAEIAAWDTSYRVNLRGPVLMARAFLPGMLERGCGIFVFVSSVGGAYMGPYEVLKTAQVDLARTLDAELEGSGVIAFTIGPGIVQTPGFLKALPQVAELYGKTPDEFVEMSRDHLISVEAAGAGFAAAIALAPRFRGLEIGSKQALLAAGIELEDAEPAIEIDQAGWIQALALSKKVRKVLEEQHQGWLQRPLFERQWVLRDFKRFSGVSIDEWLRSLESLEQAIESRDLHTILRQPASPLKLADYYAHMQEMLAGYEKDPEKLAENTATLKSWEEETRRLGELLAGG